MLANMRGLLVAAFCFVAFMGASSMSSFFRRDGEGDPCECLNWEAAYKRGVSCGMGHELTFDVSKGLFPWLVKLMNGEELCYNFFHRIDDNICVNTMHTNDSPEMWYERQWCYVANECPGSAPANTSNFVGVKFCTPGKDRLLRDKTPAELFDWARLHNLDLAMASKFAYRVESGNASWSRVQTLFTPPDETPDGVALAAVEESSSAKIREMQETGQSYVLYSDNKRPPFAVMKGGKVWKIEKDDDNYVHGQPFSFTAWKCIHGCDDSD